MQRRRTGIDREGDKISSREQEKDMGEENRQIKRSSTEELLVHVLPWSGHFANWHIEQGLQCTN